MAANDVVEVMKMLLFKLGRKFELFLCKLDEERSFLPCIVSPQHPRIRLPWLSSDPLEIFYKTKSILGFKAYDSVSAGIGEKFIFCGRFFSNYCTLCTTGEPPVEPTLFLT